MASSEPDLSLLPKGRLQLAIKAFQASQVANIYATSQIYKVPYAILYRRWRDRATYKDAHINNQLLTTIEEKALIQRIISLDNNGFSPTLQFVHGMANLFYTNASLVVNGLKINYINKLDFLRLFYQTRLTTFTSKNIKASLRPPELFHLIYRTSYLDWKSAFPTHYITTESWQLYCCKDLIQYNWLPNPYSDYSTTSYPRLRVRANPKPKARAKS